MVRSFRRSIVPLLLLAAGCSRRDAPAPETIRLFDRLGEVAIEGGAAAAGFSGRRPAPVADPAANGSGLVASVARRIGEGYDRRAAFVVVPGTRLVWERPAPGARELRVGLAAVVGGSESAGKLRFRVSARALGGSVATLSEVELDAVPDGPWRDLRVELPRAGIDRLELALEPGGGANGAWSAPELVAAPAAGRPDGARPNVILLSLDTLRSDRLGAYGYAARPTSPQLDRFAAGALRFETAVSQAPWTRPSHRAMLSGVHPASRGGLTRHPLPATLWAAGYRTLALTAGGQVDARFDFDEGFESYAVDRQWLNEPERALAAVEAAPGREFFLFLHTYEIHDPYTDGRFLAPGACPRLEGSFSNRKWAGLKRKLSDEEKACVGALYDGDVAFADERVGRLLARLEEDGLADDTIVVVTSDHGEQFWEHGGWRHGDDMYEHQIRVPLLVRLPERLRERFAGGTPGRRGAAVITDPVALVDLAPSLYELLGVKHAPPMHGRSFVPLLEGRRSEPREILSENTNVAKVERKSIRTERFKFIRTYSKIAGRKAPGPEFRLFELRRDPGEQNDIAALHPEALRALALRLDALTAGGLGDLDDENAKGLDADLRKELEALGYLGR